MTTETTKMLLEKASKAVEKGVEVEIINLKPAALKRSNYKKVRPILLFNPFSNILIKVES